MVGKYRVKDWETCYEKLADFVVSLRAQGGWWWWCVAGVDLGGGARASLALRDISGLVKPGQLVDSENLTTLFVVVGKYSVKDWETCYEKLADFVVSVLHTSIRVA